jgi:FkbM family methyltransferase
MDLSHARAILRDGWRSLPRPVQNALQRPKAAFQRWELHRRIEGMTGAVSKKILDQAQAHPGQKLFIDCGFNKGEVLEAFVKHLPGFQFYGFEVNKPYFGARAAELQSIYPNILDLNFSAVWDRDGIADFRISGTDDAGVHTAEGTTILKNFHMNEKSEGTYQVRTVDFSRWLRETIEKHTVNGIKPFVVVKMDIEGAEYNVLEELVRDGTVTNLHDLLVEFHTKQFDEDQRASYARREEEIRRDLSAAHVSLLDWV